MGEHEPAAEIPSDSAPVGRRLHDARVALGLDLEEVGARTRIPLRHLDAIETGDYSALPSRTYAMGFARAYARAVGADEPSIARDLRVELAARYQRREPKPDLEDFDIGRAPSKGLIWAGAILALLLLVGVGLYYGSGLFGRASAPTPVADTGTAGDLGLSAGGSSAAAPAASPAAPAGGQVVLTATDEVWVRVYDAANTTLLLKTMAAGERFEVPAGANNPMINVGRPDKLAVTVNGSAVPPLGSGERAIKDVPVGAAALLARSGGAAPAAPVAQPTASPAPAAATTNVPPFFAEPGAQAPAE